MSQLIGLILSVLAAFVFIGCGGGGSSSATAIAVPTSVATFIDSPVSGLEFDTAYETAVTDANGNFRYTEGETVTFHIGNLYLGSAVPKNGKVTPLDIIKTADTSDARVIRILQTLQSLDSDGNTSNGITIDSAITATFSGVHQVRVDLDKVSTTDNDVLAAIGKAGYTVDAVTARSHFEQHKDDASNSSHGYTPPFATSNGQYTLVAWNDLGMHCMDGSDYSIFSILPPYNNLHAHLISRDVTSGKSITSGVTLTYEAVADTTGSINTTSVGKTNLWDSIVSSPAVTYVMALFRANPAINYGLNISNGTSNPAPGLTPAGMTYNAINGWWEAEGIVQPFLK